MIDTSYLNQVREMNEQDFINIAAADDKFTLVNVVPVDEYHWAIFGPAGVYVSPAGERKRINGVRLHFSVAAGYTHSTGFNGETPIPCSKAF